MYIFIIIVTITIWRYLVILYFTLLSFIFNSIGAHGVGRRHIKNTLIMSHPEKFAYPIPRLYPVYMDVLILLISILVTTTLIVHLVMRLLS